MPGQYHARLVWVFLLTATGFIFAAAVLTPFFPLEVQAAVRWAFAPACHQLPGRSPHIAGVPIAICDRCAGIYFGVFMGVGILPWGSSLWRRMGSGGRYVLLGSLIPLGLDWVGPVLGLWNNVPYSRALTGLLFGIVAASYVTDRLIRHVPRMGDGTDPDVM